jgi:hypothetical protein
MLKEEYEKDIEESEKEMDYEHWYNKNETEMIEDFLRDNKEFDRLCKETYEMEMSVRKKKYD